MGEDVIVIKVSGGLGNQMQQYALYRKFKEMGREAYLDLTWFSPENQKKAGARRGLELFFYPQVHFEEEPKEVLRFFSQKRGNKAERILRRWFAPLKGRLPLTARPEEDYFFTEKEMYHPEIFSFQTRELDGFFHCQKYTEDIRERLLHDFSFPPHSDAGQEKKVREQEVRMGEENSIALHIRGGDYLQDSANLALFGGIATKSYYRGALRYLKERMPEAKIYLFTNDEAYAGQMLEGETYTVVRGNAGRDALQDIRLMRACRADLCANSTFSIWGGRLNDRSDRILVRPPRMKNTQRVPASLMHEYWKGWVLVNEEGIEV